MIESTKTSNLPNCQVPNGCFCICKFYHLVMEVLQKITRPFKAFYTVSVPLARENLGGLKELFLQKNPAVVISKVRKKNSTSLHFKEYY